MDGKHSISSIFAAAVAALMLCSVSVPAQMTMSGHDMGGMREIPPPDQLPAPLHMTGIGNSHLTITTASPEAQVWFDQGLNLYHDFWDYESARAFEQAVRVDPNCAMCYWGLSRALEFRGGQGAYAKLALESAKKLAKHSSKQEQLYIKAADAKDKKATKIYQQMVENDPNDLQAKIFLAGSLGEGYTDAGEPKPGTVTAIELDEEILKSAPNDSAANHYWIHRMEPGLHPELALPSAKLLASLAPASGHMVHMPGHIFYRVGDYADAETWFAQSTAVDEAYMQAQHVSVDDDWNYVHNLMYGVANLMEQGKMKAATTLSAKLVSARGDSPATLYTFSPRDSMTRISPLLPVALRTADWPTILKLLQDSKPDAKLENLTFLAGELREFATGMNALQSNDVAAAEASSKKLDDALAAMKQKIAAMPETKEDKNPKPPVKQAVMPDAMVKPLSSSLAIMSLELRASILAAKKDLPKAKEIFAQAAKAEKDLGYREPPTYIRPVGETEGLVLLRAGDAEGAHAAYAAALVERPNSGFGLYGLARSSEVAHKPEVAREEFSRFLTAWKSADPATPELEHAQEFLASKAATAAGQ
jgi:tetratricopeptide (TPR) repeat protein